MCKTNSHSHSERLTKLQRNAQAETVRACDNYGPNRQDLNANAIRRARLRENIALMKVDDSRAHQNSAIRIMVTHTHACLQTDARRTVHFPCQRRCRWRAETDHPELSAHARTPTQHNDARLRK